MLELLQLLNSYNGPGPDIHEPVLMSFWPLVAMGVSAGIGLLNGRNQSRAARDAAQMQVDASGNAIAGIRPVVDQATGRVIDAGNTAAAGVENAAAGAASGVRQAGVDATGRVDAASDRANTTLADIYRQAQDRTNPYAQAGERAIAGMEGLSNERFTFSEDDPSFQFRMSEAMKAIEKSAAARGSLGSGATLKALQDRSSNLASTEYQAAFNRFQTDRQNRGQSLAALLGAGQTATGQALQAGRDYGAGYSNNTMGAATYGGDAMQGAAARAGQFDMTGATTAGGFRTDGARTGGAFEIDGARTIADLTVGAGDARAAGRVGSADAWARGLTGVGRSATDYILLSQLGRPNTGGGAHR